MSARVCIQTTLPWETLPTVSTQLLSGSALTGPQPTPSTPIPWCCQEHQELRTTQGSRSGNRSHSVSPCLSKHEKWLSEEVRYEETSPGPAPCVLQTQGQTRLEKEYFWNTERMQDRRLHLPGIKHSLPLADCFSLLPLAYCLPPG